MNKSIKTTTPRLSIQPLTETDHHFIYELVNTAGWLKFIGDRNVGAPEAAIDYILKILGNENVCYWVVRLRESQTPVGVITFIQRTYLVHPDIGFAFLPDFSGNGYAYEAAKAVLDALIAQEELYHILATTMPENVRSIQLLKKMGLVFEREIEVEGKTLQVYGSTVGQLKN